MGNSLNLRNVYGNYIIAQGDNSSTFTYEIQDQNRMIMKCIDNTPCKVYLTKDDIVYYEYSSFIFDGCVEFNISKQLGPGDYRVEIVVEIDSSKYVFPSDGKTRIRVSDSVLGIK